jgi:glycosyltransferase involved in cell wall biosynthesis
MRGGAAAEEELTLRVLYISYDGLLEPLGESQVLQYLKGLARGHEITLLTYEKKADWCDVVRRTALSVEVRHAGIRWVALRYHQRPSVPATAYDLSVGILMCMYLVVRRRIEIVHARSYVPSVIALWLKKCFGIKYIFDMRSFWADERVDGAESWSSGSWIYWVTKWFERQFLLSADVIVSLTQRAVHTIRTFPYLVGRRLQFVVIPTCTNLELFRPPPQEATGRSDLRPEFTIGYVGTVTGWYLFEPAVEAFRCIRARRPDAKLLIVNRGQHAYIRECLRKRDIPDDCVEIVAASYSAVPALMHKMNVTVFFIKPVYSKQASAPTKLGEFLGCGIPCLTNSGIGDVDELLRTERVGVIARGFTPEAINAAAGELLLLAQDREVRARCRRAATKHFSLEEGRIAYDRIYRSLGGDGVAATWLIGERNETS